MDCQHSETRSKLIKGSKEVHMLASSHFQSTNGQAFFFLQASKQGKKLNDICQLSLRWSMNVRDGGYIPRRRGGSLRKLSMAGCLFPLVDWHKSASSGSAGVDAA